MNNLNLNLAQKIEIIARNRMDDFESGLLLEDFSVEDTDEHVKIFKRGDLICYISKALQLIQVDSYKFECVINHKCINFDNYETAVIDGFLALMYNFPDKVRM